MVLNAGLAEAQFSFPVQPLGRIVCVYSAVPNQVRSEGLAERTGDARLDCTNDGVYNPAIEPFNNVQQYVLANITVQLNTAVTNMLDVGGDDDPANNVTDSVLIVNDNNHFAPIEDSVLPDDGGCSYTDGPYGVPDERYPCPQKGRLQGPNALTWNGVQFPVPGAPNNQADLPEPDIDGIPICDDIFNQYSDDSCFDPLTTIRITNIRANAAAVGAGGAIFANLTIFSFAGISVMPSNQQTVANVFQGLTVDYGSDVSGLQCEEFADVETYIELEEGFAGSFKTLGAPTFVQGDFAAENGYPVCEEGGFLNICTSPQSNAGTGGGATQATRFLIRFFGIPAGVNIWVDNAVEGDGSDSSWTYADCPVEGPSGDRDLCVERVVGANADGEGGASEGGVGSYEVGLDSDGNGYVVYELKNGDPFRLQSIRIYVWAEWDPDTALDEPAIGSGQFNATFAPLSDEGEAGNFPKPRFIDTGGDPETFITVVRCSTTLLFPFVSNRAGFDTGLVISNTSLDWKGTAPQDGRCMIHYIGSTGESGVMPDDDLSTVIPGGEQLIFTLSQGNAGREVNGAPNFQGFVIAMCEFQYAHGVAFMSDATSGVPAWSQGYLALVLQFDGDGDRMISCRGDSCASEALQQ